MEKKLHTIFDMETGEEITREMTAEEIENLDKPYYENPDMAEQIEAEKQRRKAIKESALNKLQDLGLTEEEIKAFLG